MSLSSTPTEHCHPQQAIKAKCFHPSNSFIEFRRGEIEQSIPARFEHQVAKYAERLAVKTRSHTLTYEALNKAANRVARAILTRQESGEGPIALLFEPGAMMIVAILGVLKAGKVCVPLVPSHPRTRTTYILNDSQASLILTDAKHVFVAKQLHPDENQLMNIEAVDPSAGNENLGTLISADALAYILYTSGSTGQPKGVVHNHRNIIHLIMRNTNSLHLCPEDRLSLLSTYSHIAGVTDIFRALLNGAAVFLFDLKEEGLVDLADWLINEEITFYHSVPSVFRDFLETLNTEKEFPKIRLIHLGGEPVSKRDVDLYKRYFSATCILFNNLGATEISGYQQYLIDNSTQITDSIVPSGYSVEDTEVLLLNDAGEPVGFNEVGEIAVKSCYLALGYWRKADLTRTAFLPDPEGGTKRIYRTGDLGRMVPDGCLFHLGRKDFQVKVRGHRIEPSEIELALLDLDAVKDAVVLAREDRPGDKRLVAYIVPARQPAPTVSKLRRFLSSKMPDYMVPSVYVILDALPLTPNGKVDRQALPVPDLARPALDTAFVAPRTPVEEVLTRIWAKLLCVEQVGIYDNFFELGGHSLLAIRLSSRLRDTFNLEISLPSLFDAPTVAGLSQVIIAKEARPGQAEKIACVFIRVHDMSDEEAKNILRNKRSARGDQ